MRLSFLALALFFSISCLLAGCDAGAAEESGATTLSGYVTENDDFSIFAEGARATGLLDIIDGAEQEFTLLLPDDIAFRYIGEDTRDALFDPMNRDLLRRVLRAHLIRGRIEPGDLIDGDTLRSISGVPLPVQRVGSGVNVAGVDLDLATRTEREGGVAYPLSGVILNALNFAERLRVTSSFSTFGALADQSGVAPSGSGPFTAFVSTQSAFEQLGSGLTLLESSANTSLLQRVLELHIVPGERIAPVDLPRTLTTQAGDEVWLTEENGTLYYAGQRVVGGPVDTEDGRIYLLSSLPLSQLTVRDRIRLDLALSTYVQELRAEVPDLWDRLDDSEAVTLFAPTNGAFLNLSSAVRTALDQNVNNALYERLLRVPAVEEAIVPADLTDGREFVAIEGSTLGVQVGDTRTFIGLRQVDPEPAEASNGYIYTVDGFIQPDVDGLDTAILRGYTAHAFAVRQANLESFFRETPLTVFAFSNSAYSATPGIFQNPDLDQILLYHATRQIIPFFSDGIVFETEEGTSREIVEVGSPDFPFALDGNVFIGRGSATLDGSGVLHTAQSITQPPSDFQAATQR